MSANGDFEQRGETIVKRTCFIPGVAVTVWLCFLCKPACPEADKAGDTSANQPRKGKTMLSVGDFEDAVLVSVDIQQMRRPKSRVKGEKLKAMKLTPTEREMGFKARDKRAALDYFFDTALPNAAKLAEFFRSKNIPVILVHWGYRLRDGMDLDPAVRNYFIHNFGPNPARWGHYIDNWGSRPNVALNVQETDYVLAKTAQDAFTSCNIDFVLQNLGAKTLFLMGGHTNGCLFWTSKSAIAKGYRTICIEDATWDAVESTRLPGIRKVPYDLVVKTADVQEMKESVPVREEQDKQGSPARQGPSKRHLRKRAPRMKKEVIR